MTSLSTSRAEVERSGLSINALGMLVFISSEATFFLFLLIAYVSYRDANLQGPNASQVLNVGRTAVFSACLFASSITVWLAERRLGRHDLGGFQALMLTTIGLGLVFLAGQVWEYHDLAGQDLALSRNLFGSTFFTLTGFHGLHVAIGLVLLGVLTALARAGDVRSPRSPALQSIVYYWHFVDAVWVLIFSAVYLWSLAG